ncbi:MAG: 5'-methylthioadenosine/adenosylhomocysteine nucleosidase [Phycisphaeraceae bacterium]|nr:5'-methylthioadenosine/adenosylhomocysteine nucleosidase [Phycisphaeraceae bacterium]
MTIGIMTAVPEEANLLARAMRRDSEHAHGGRTYYTGELEEKRIVLVFSRMGKVAAAVTAQHLIDVHRVSSIIFSGVAGALDPNLRVGDVVVGKRLWQHDMDASPLVPPLELPLLNVSSFECDSRLREALEQSAAEFVRHDFQEAIGSAAAAELGIPSPRVFSGDIASGDRFVASAEDREEVRRKVPSALCVEMEGGAVAQVCYEQGVPLGVVRVISDSANEHAAVDFGVFVNKAASQYGLGIIRRALRHGVGG